MKKFKYVMYILYSLPLFLLDRLLVLLKLREDKYKNGLLIRQRVYPPRQYTDEEIEEHTRLVIESELEFIGQMRERILENSEYQNVDIILLTRYASDDEYILCSDEALDTLIEVFQLSPPTIQSKIIEAIDKENKTRCIPMLESVIATEIYQDTLELALNVLENLKTHSQQNKQ